MILHEMREQTAVVFIDRHDKRNALDVAHLDALQVAVTDATTSGARAVVVTGIGTSFSAGADLGRVYGDGFRTSLYRALDAIRRAEVPVIAAVNGPAIGAGAQLAIACDLRVASDTATFAVPTARNGLAVDPWTVRRLALLCGGGPARALLLGCASLDVEEARLHGLVDRRGDLDAALAWADEISRMAPLSLAYSKRALDDLFEDDQSVPQHLHQLFEACWASDDVAESNRARAERRPPVFVGRKQR